MQDARLSAPSVARNREPILAVLRDVLPPQGDVLEIASGSGEHAAHFAENFPKLVFHPSDPDEAARRSIAAWRDFVALPNLRAPFALDVRTDRWPIATADAILCINMVHISPWTATLGLLDGAARILDRGAPLFFYGPFERRGVETVQSNLDFDAWLKAKDPAFGLRDLDELAACATARGFSAPNILDMPANNLSVIFRRA